jgi:hypothetical protein
MPSLPSPHLRSVMWPDHLSTTMGQRLELHSGAQGMNTSIVNLRDTKLMPYFLTTFVYSISADDRSWAPRCLTDVLCYTVGSDECMASTAFLSLQDVCQLKTYSWPLRASVWHTWFPNLSIRRASVSKIWNFTFTSQPRGTRSLRTLSILTGHR